MTHSTPLFAPRTAVRLILLVGSGTENLHLSQVTTGNHDQQSACCASNSAATHRWLMPEDPLILRDQVSLRLENRRESSLHTTNDLQSKRTPLAYPSAGTPLVPSKGLASAHHHA